MTKQMARLLVDLKNTPEWDEIEYELAGRMKDVVERVVIKALRMAGME